MEIFTFLYYANEESDDVIGGSTKLVQHSITNISRSIKAVFFKLGTRNKHHKRKKWHLSCCCHDNSYAAGPVLIKTKIPRFYLKQGSSFPNNLMGIVKTIWEPCVFGERPSVPLLMVGNGDIWFSTERDWSHECYHGSILEGVILFLLSCTVLVPSLKNTASIFLEILLIECCTFLVESF